MKIQKFHSTSTIFLTVCILVLKKILSTVANPLFFIRISLVICTPSKHITLLAQKKEVIQFQEI